VGHERLLDSEGRPGPVGEMNVPPAQTEEFLGDATTAATSPKAEVAGPPRC
jgi:hypothetical protein